MFPLHIHAMLLALAVAFAMPLWLSPIIAVLLPLLTGFIGTKTFEPFQAAWKWLNTAHPLVRFVGSGVWGGILGFLGTVGITLVCAPGVTQCTPSTTDAAGWTAFISALVTWGWKALSNAMSKSAAPAAPVA